MSKDPPEEVERVRQEEEHRLHKPKDEEKLKQAARERRAREAQCAQLLRGSWKDFDKALRAAGLKPGMPQYDEAVLLRRQVMQEQIQQRPTRKP